MEDRREYRGREQSLNTMYFYRFFVPLVVSTLVLLAIGVVITYTPGTPVSWFLTFNNAFQMPTKIGGRRWR